MAGSNDGQGHFRKWKTDFGGKRRTLRCSCVMVAKQQVSARARFHSYPRKILIRPSVSNEDREAFLVCIKISHI
jgi:hypothetical protein